MLIVKSPSAARPLLALLLAPLALQCSTAEPEPEGGALSGGGNSGTGLGGSASGGTAAEVPAGGANATAGAASGGSSAPAGGAAGSVGTPGGATASAGAPGSAGGATPSAGGAPALGGTGPALGGAAGAASGGIAPTGSVNGYARNPIVSHIYTADPSAKVFGDRVYVYASHDEDDQSSWAMLDYHVFSSDDLANWQDHGVVLEAAKLGWVKSLYAPDACFSEKTGKYYLYYPNSGSSVGVAVGDTPVGPFSDPLGKPLVSQSTPGVDDVEWVFDPTCLIDADGQAYLYFGGGMPGTGDNARVIRLGDDMISLKDAKATTIVAPDFFEASFVHKYAGKYYFSYSTTFKDHAPTIDYMISDSPMSGFVFAGTALPSPKGNANDNNHHSIVEFKGNWYMFYHTRVLSTREGKSKFQRSITLDNLTYASDGKINTVSATQGVVKQLKAGNALARWEAETIADQRGIEVDFVETDGKKAGVAVTDVQNGDWIGYSQLDFGSGAGTFQARVASAASAAASIDIYLDGCNEFTEQAGTKLTSCSVAPTGGLQSWNDIECTVPTVSGVHDLCLQFAGGGGELLRLDYFLFK